MTPLTKLVGTLVGTVAAGFGSYNLFKDLTAGTLAWKGALADSALIVGGLATSWIFGGLPGLGVAAVAAAFAGLAGTAKTAKDEADAALKRLLDSEWKTVGVNITDVAAGISEYCSSLVEAESVFNTSYSALENIKTAAQEASDNLGILLENLNPEDWNADKMNEVKVAFQELEEKTSEYANGAVESLQNYVNVNSEFIAAVGGDVEEVNRIIEEAKTNANSQIDEITKKIDSLTSKENLSADDISQLKTLYDQLAAITGVDIGPTNSSLEALNSEISTLSSTNINLESFDTTQTAVSNIAKSLTDAKNELDEAKGNIEATIETLAISDEDKQYLKDTFTAVFVLKDQDLQKVAEGLDPIKEKMTDVVDQGLADIRNGHLEGFGDFFCDEIFKTNRSEQEIKKMQQEWLSSIGMTGGSDNFIKNSMLKNGMSLTDYETLFNIEAAEEIALTTSERLDNLAQNMWGVTYGDVIQSQISAGSEDLGHAYITGFSGEISTDAKIVMEAVGKLTKATFNESLKKQQTKNGGLMYDAFMQGYINSALKNSAKAEEPSTKLGSIAVSALKTELDSHSPSKVTEKIGKDFDTGFVNGITGNSTIVIFSVVSLVSQITSAFSGIDLTDTGKNIGESLSNGFSEGLRGVVDSCNSTLWRFELFEIEMMNAFNDAVPAFQQMANGISTVVGMGLGNIDFIDYTSRGRQIPGYATGGYPRRADLFYANENGVPEMVGRIGARTAVANTDQITTAIAAAVRAAIRESGGMQSGNSSKQQGDTYIFLDSDEISYRIECRNAAKAKMTGGIK